MLVVNHILSYKVVCDSPVLSGDGIGPEELHRDSGEPSEWLLGGVGAAGTVRTPMGLLIPLCMGLRDGSVQYNNKNICKVGAHIDIPPTPPHNSVTVTFNLDR